MEKQRSWIARPLHPKFGVEISDIDVRNINQCVVKSLRSMLVKHGVVLIRSQQLDEHAYEAFTRQVGNGVLELSARRVSHGRVVPAISELTNVVDDHGRPLGFGGNDTDYWHSDQEFREKPATLGALYCRIPSTVGGETSFASTAIDNLKLPPALLAKIRSLWSTRKPASTHDNVEHIEVMHPVVLRMPVDGRELLYHSENTERFVGMDVKEGTTLRQQLLDYILKHENIYSHSWQTEDLILYDNAQVVHRREAFTGQRWLQGAKIFAPNKGFAKIDGLVCHHI